MQTIFIFCRYRFFDGCLICLSSKYTHIVLIAKMSLLSKPYSQSTQLYIRKTVCIKLKNQQTLFLSSNRLLVADVHANKNIIVFLKVTCVFCCLFTSTLTLVYN